MKHLIIIFFGIISFTSFAQNKKEVKLNWKIGKNEKLSYKTVMNDIDTSIIDFNFNGLYKALADSTKTNEAKNFFKQLNDSFKNIDLVSNLTNKGNGVINIVMEAKPKPKQDNKNIESDTSKSKKDFSKMMQAMSQGVMLRGSVYETGGIHSFWVKSNQKNLIALFFQLPSKSVKVGDSWELDINFIGNDQSFECDSAFKQNKVSLIDLKKVNGETIAVIKYDMVEYVKGNFNAPSFMGQGGAKETMMKFTHQGISEFSIDKGRWISYDGIMSFESTGFMTSNTKKKFSLIEEKNASR